MAFQLKRNGPTFDIETEKDSFKEWKQQWEAFSFNSGLEAIVNADDKKRHTIMALREALSRETLRTVKNLQLTETQQNDPNLVINALERHIEGSVNEVVWRHRFFCRHRQPHEDFNDWLIELKDTARKCNFARCCNACQDLHIRDQIVVGIGDDETQQELLSKGSELTLAAAITVCETMESARKDTSTIKRPTNSASINAVKSRYRKTKAQPAMTKAPPSTDNTAKCPWCGGPGWHAKKGQREKCPANNQTCSKCSKKKAILKVYAAQHQHPARAAFQPSSHQ